MQRFCLILSLLCLWPMVTGLAVAPRWGTIVASSARPNVSDAAVGVREEWLGIYQDEEKVGYVQRLLVPIKTGYDWQEHWWLSLHLLHDVQTTHTEVRAHADHNCTLTSFSLWSVGAGAALYINAAILHPGAPQQKVSGESISNGNIMPFTVALPTPLQLPPLCQMAAPMASRPGAYREFSVFNPIALRTETVGLTTIGPDMINFNGHPQAATKLISEINETPLYLWLDQDGQTLKEEIAPGVVLRKESRETVAKGDWQEKGLSLARSTLRDAPEEKP